MSRAEEARFEAARAQALSDLADLEQQVADGEIDGATADRLRAVYRAEAAAAERSLASLAAAPAEPGPRGPSPRRMLAGAAVLLVGGGLLTFAVVQAVEPRQEGGIVTGGLPEREAPRDLADVSTDEMEAVVAANPDVVPMRLALARRYVEAGDFSAALPHYLTILEAEANVEALAYVGWMTFLSGESEVGARYLERALEVDPAYPQALWFLANVRLAGLDDPVGAVPLLETLLADPALPADIRAAAEELLAEARAA